MISLWRKCREETLEPFDWLIMNIKDFMLVEWQIEIQCVFIWCSPAGATHAYMLLNLQHTRWLLCCYRGQDGWENLFHFPGGHHLGFLFFHILIFHIT
uniref:Uncharacterized protein n=1 Tax=Ursus americanus TaxID=9643 RepID=A0A452QNN6_URSAM